MTDTPTTVLLTFRDTLRKRSPPWLQTGWAEKILYSIGVQCDAFADALIAGVQSRFPNYYDEQSLPILGRERRIPRGRSESHRSYGARLSRFLTDHRYRGGPYAMLSQLYYYFHPDNFRIDLIYYNGPRFTLDVTILDAGGTLEDAITRGFVHWSPDTNTAKWARWWLFYWTDRWADAPPTETEIADLRFVPRQWNAAHPFGTIVIMSGVTELWNFPLEHTWNEPGTWNTTGAPIFIDLEASV